jgi:lambda family phage tail tape measure protein
MAIISRLAVLLGLDAGEFNQNLGMAKDKVEGFSVGAKISLAAVGTAFVAASKEAIQFADQINDVAKANEVAVESVLELSQALALNGGNIDDNSKIFASFTNKVDEAVQGSDKLRKSFKELGVTTKDLGNLTEQELLEKTLKGLSNIEDPIRRNALAFDLLGKAVKGVDVKGLYADYEKAKGSFAGSDEVYKRIGVSIDAMDVRWLHFKDNLAKNVLPVLEAIAKAMEAIHRVNQKLDPYFEKIDKFFGMGPKGAQGSSTYSPMDYSGAAGPNFTADRSGLEAKRKIEQSDSEKKATEALKKQQEFYEKEMLITQAKGERLKKEYELAFLTENERKLQLELFDIEQKRKQLTLGDQFGRKMTEEQANAWANAEKARAQEAYAIGQQQRDFEYGWKKAFATYTDNATNAAKLGEQAFVSITNTMESALDEFVRTGKLNFSSLAQSIISDLIKIQLKAQATSIFSKIDIGGLFGGLFGGGGGYTPGYSSLASAPYPKFADGGDVTGPSIVGERGPELFIPKTPGTIIPNNQLGSLNNQPQVVYNGPYIANMSAIDTQSATQFLAANKQAVWSANQSAQRGLPQSR